MKMPEGDVSAMTKLYNLSKQSGLRRALRREMSPPEAKVWSRLRGRQILGYKFRRQFGIGPYVLDFYCPELKLAVEVDGESHFQAGADERDVERQTFIESFGIQFLRFTTVEVGKNLEGILQRIYQRAGDLGTVTRG
jgi:very-short-patch-repair endonuclease